MASSNRKRIQKELPVGRPELRRLYERVGGEAGLEKVLSEFYRRMAADVLIGFFFIGKDTDAIARKQKEFLMRAMGAFPSYRGLPPAQAHLQLPPIVPGHFDRRLRLLEATLRDHGLSAEDIRTWVSFESAFRDSVVKG